MMKFWNRLISILGIILVFSFEITAQNNLNLTVQGHLEYKDGINDLAGWSDEKANEYAIVGTSFGISIVDIDTFPITEIFVIPVQGPAVRDINTFGHYAYVGRVQSHVSQNFALQIIDLQYLPDSIKTYQWDGHVPGEDTCKHAHTIWIDEFGILYLNGTNLNNGGFIMFDIASNPLEPKYLGKGVPVYAHDVYSRDSIVYSAEFGLGNVSIYDVTKPENVKWISTSPTPRGSTHNTWLSDNSRYLFTTDEQIGGYVTSFDIQSLSKPVELDRFRQAATGAESIPHNVYVKNDWLVIAYNTCGTLIVDAARPDNLIEVGRFDSDPGSASYGGVWGSDPFLPSGRIISSDRGDGLFVLVPEYKHAAYLEGTVIDTNTKLPIFGAEITILSDEIVLPTFSGIDGIFKTGKAIPGLYEVLVEKEGYYSKTITLNFENGQVLEPNIELRSVETVSTKELNPANNGISIFPVPLRGNNLNIDFHGMQWNRMDFTILNSQGLVLFHDRLTAPNSVLSFPQFNENSLLFLKWKSDTGSTGVEKILICKD